MLVQSKPGARCPQEGKPRQYIDDKTPVEAPDSAYYRRLIAEGSLVVVSAETKTQRRAGAPSTPKKEE
jgi:hypothetical protein